MNFKVFDWSPTGQGDWLVDNSLIACLTDLWWIDASLFSTGMSLYRTARIPYFLMYLMNYRWVEWNSLFSVAWLSHNLKYLSPYPQENDLKTQFQSVRLAIGGGLLKEGKIFEAMELFEMVKTPPGLYNLAQVREKGVFEFIWLVEVLAMSLRNFTRLALIWSSMLTCTSEFFSNYFIRNLRCPNGKIG